MEIPEGLLDQIRPPVQKQKVEAGQKTSYKALFANACMRRRILAMAFSWVAAVLCYNGLVFNSVNIGGSVYVNMALGVVIEVRAKFRGAAHCSDSLKANFSVRFRAISSAGSRWTASAAGPCSCSPCSSRPP